MDPLVARSSCSWQERQTPGTFNNAYESWTSTATTAGRSFLTATGWMSEAETQTVSLNDLVQQVLTTMLQDYLQSHNIPMLSPCPHTKGVQLDAIIQAMASSHQAMCLHSNQYQSSVNIRDPSYPSETEQASWMILELSNTLNRAIQQEVRPPMQSSTPRPNVSQQRKRPNRDEAGAAPERKKIKMIKAPRGTVYPCVKCGTTFGMQKDLIKHYNTVHSLTRPFKCSQCDKWFKTNSECHKHTKMIHLNQYNYRCSICNLGTSTRKKLEAHTARHLDGKDKPLQCKHCNKGFVRENELKFHMATHEAMLKVQCELCKAQWVRYHNAYKKHMEVVHRAYTRERTETHKCLVCDKAYENRPLLMDHMKEYHSDIGVACQNCGRKFPTKAKVEKHVENEHTPKVACKDCGQKFIAEKSLQKHYMKKHSSGDKYEPQVVEFKVGKVKRKLLMCKLCGGMFTERAALDQHYPVHMNNENALPNKEITGILKMQKKVAASGALDKSKSSKKGKEMNKKKKESIQKSQVSAKTREKKSKQKSTISVKTLVTKPDKATPRGRGRPRKQTNVLVTGRPASTDQKPPMLDDSKNEQHTSSKPDVLVIISKSDPSTESSREITQEGTNNAAERGEITQEGSNINNAAERGGIEKDNDAIVEVQLNQPSNPSIQLPSTS